MAGGGGLQHPEDECRGRGLAEPHREIEQRALAQMLQQKAVARLGRDMGDDAMVERVRVGGEQCRGGGGCGKAVEHDRDPPEPRRHDRPRDRGEFKPAEPAQQVERVARRRAVPRRRLRHGAALLGERRPGDAGAGAGPL